MPKFVGSNLNQVLNMQRINKTAFAKELKVSRQTLYDYLSGKSWPSHIVLKRLLNLLKPYGVTIDDILPTTKRDL